MAINGRINGIIAPGSQKVVTGPTNRQMICNDAVTKNGTPGVYMRLAAPELRSAMVP